MKELIGKHFGLLVDLFLEILQIVDDFPFDCDFFVVVLIIQHVLFRELSGHVLSDVVGCLALLVFHVEEDGVALLGGKETDNFFV